MITTPPLRLLQLPDIVIIACRQLDTTPEELRERCLDAHNRIVVIKAVIAYYARLYTPASWSEIAVAISPDDTTSTSRHAYARVERELANEGGEGGDGPYTRAARLMDAACARAVTIKIERAKMGTSL